MIDTPGRAEGGEHARTWALIPWLVNGSATPPQRRQALEHLAQCPACRAELQAQQALAAAMREAAAPEAVPDAEAGLQRLLGRLDAPPVEAQPAPRRAAGRLQGALVAAVVVQAVGLALLSLQALRHDGDEYRTLSQAVPAPAASAGRLRVLPDGQMPLAQWQALLHAQGLRVVDGPNSAGAYALAPRPEGPALRSDEALARLRATPGILLAEPIAVPR